MKNTQKIRLFFLLFAFFVFAAHSVSALEISYPKVPGALSPQEFLSSSTPEQIPSLYFKYIINLIFWTSGIIVLGVLIWAGIRYLTSAGDAATMAGAKQQISSAFLGILLLLSSFIVLNILNPQMIILKLPAVQPATTTPSTEVPPPATTTEMTRTSIDTELPLGKVIEDYLFSATRTVAIKNNASTTLNIANTLKDQIDDLKDTVDDCDCGEAKPKCKGTINIGGYGSDQECQTEEGNSCNVFCTDDCSSDVCADERDDIEDLEKKNLQKLDELKAEQIKSIQELKGIKIELVKLQRLENFMKECPMWRVGSLSQFLYDKDFYINQGWTLRNVEFWENIIIGDDWVTLYCPVSGTILGETAGIPAESITLELPPTEAPTAEQQAACSTKIPVGEIIDRAERIANRLINRLENLIKLDRQMTQEVNEMHVLVSKCSSQQPMCCSFCFEIQIKVVKVCIRQCIGQACPFSDISDKKDEIDETQGKIEETVNDTDEKNMGIIPLIDNVVPKLLEDLKKIVRAPIKDCITDIPVEGAMESTEPQVILSDCESAVRTVGPDGVVIQKCCWMEKEYQKCLQDCYTKSGKDYDKCLSDCVKDNEEISTCNHANNFYCCGL